MDQLTAKDRPVLGLDTCDFLDVVRGAADGAIFRYASSRETGNSPDGHKASVSTLIVHAQSFREVGDALRNDPDRFQPVVTYLVPHEWRQNLGKVAEDVRNRIALVDEQVRDFSEACKIMRLPPLDPVPSFSALPIITGLIDLAEELLNRAIVIEKDDVCVGRALDRVMDHRRPSHRNEIKDSIHWEHHLELSRRLGAAGHASDRIFVSANKADFWANKNKSSLHPDLLDEAGSVDLQFIGKLSDALRVLGV